MGSPELMSAGQEASGEEKNIFTELQKQVPDRDTLLVGIETIRDQDSARSFFEGYTAWMQQEAQAKPDEFEQYNQGKTPEQAAMINLKCAIGHLPNQEERELWYNAIPESRPGSDQLK